MPLGILNGLINLKQSKKANKELDKVLELDPTYSRNPLTAQMFTLNQNLFNGRMAGAPQLERNIFTNNANFNAQVGRNATDSSQALALAAAGQGQTDQSLQDLQVKEQQNKYGMLDNLNRAYGAMVNEGDKEYQDKIRKFENYAIVKGMQRANKANAVQGIFNGLNSDFNDATSIFGLGQGGLLGGLFGGGKKQQQTSGINSGGGMNFFRGWSPSYQY